MIAQNQIPDASSPALTAQSAADSDGSKASNARETLPGSLRRRFPLSGFGQGLSGPLARCALVGLVTLCLLIPLGLVGDMVKERWHQYSAAVTNLSDSWGNAQTVSGPALLIPYQVWEDVAKVVKVEVNGREESRETFVRELITHHKVVLPADLAFNVRLDPEIRYRGIYRRALYNAPVNVNGNFVLPGRNDFSGNVQKIHWDKAWLCIGISDLRAVSEALPGRWENADLPAYSPGTDAGQLLGSGFHVGVALDEKEAGARRSFSLKLKIRGSGGIYFTPVGINTRISMSGSWPTPSFQGNLLPAERSISEQGFTAEWRIPNLARTYPQSADLDSPEYGGKEQADTYTRAHRSAITAFTAGVYLFEPVTLYSMVERSVDYGILFISGTFVALFAFELAGRRRLHPVQYAMVGLSMSLFYLVMLSLAEHMSFGPAFAVASAVTVLMNGLYMASAMQSRFRGLFMGGLLTGLYALLYSILQMEDHALLIGTGLVLAMMGVLMFVTRKLPQSDTAAG
ncbi:MAG: cell envelope integrity protein CreD [Desulfovibrio sp.]|jgi:inner membrane protein|nr:cell envelope integrity protein CreD [Desulfovibrio sp.]